MFTHFHEFFLFLKRIFLPGSKCFIDFTIFLFSKLRLDVQFLFDFILGISLIQTHVEI